MTPLLHSLENHKKPQLSLNVIDMVVSEIGQMPATGLVVNSVKSGGRAELAGVMAGDIISEVDGSPAITLKDLNLIFETHVWYQPFRFLFQREGKWRYLALPCSTCEIPHMDSIPDRPALLNG